MAKRNAGPDTVEIETVAQARDLIESCVLAIVGGDGPSEAQALALPRCLEMSGVLGGVEGKGFAALVSLARARAERERLEVERAKAADGEARRRQKLETDAADVERQVSRLRAEAAEAAEREAATRFVPDAPSKPREAILADLQAAVKSAKDHLAEVKAQAEASGKMWAERLKEAEQMRRRATVEYTECNRLMDEARAGR